MWGFVQMNGNKENLILRKAKEADLGSIIRFDGKLMD